MDALSFSSTTPLDVLTPREREVLMLIAAGFTNQEIAEKLVIRPKTVKNHLTHILAKLHLANRSQLIAFAWHNQLVTATPTSGDK